MEAIYQDTEVSFIKAASTQKAEFATTRCSYLPIVM